MPHTQKQIPHELWRVMLDFRRDVNEAMAETIAEQLEDLVSSAIFRREEREDAEDNWGLEMIVHGTPDTEEMHRRLSIIAAMDGGGDLLDQDGIRAERLPERDWLAYVHEHFPPVTVGRFFLYGSHYNGELPDGLDALQIDAATAFGSGEHPSTQGCLLALQDLARTEKFSNALDMGCGSGILAIAMTKLWPGLAAAAVDIDHESIIVSRRHAATNGAADSVTAVEGDGYAAPLVAQAGPFDIITANILAGPLADMAPDLARNLKKGGFCVLAGLLTKQAAQVSAAHEKEGLRPAGGHILGEWQTLVLQKPA